MVLALDIYVRDTLNTVTKIHRALLNKCFWLLLFSGSVWIESVQLKSMQHRAHGVSPLAEQRAPTIQQQLDGVKHRPPTTHSPRPLNQNKQHRQSIWNIFKFINMPKAKARLSGSDESAPAAPFPPFLFIWLGCKRDFHEWTGREMSERGLMIAIRVFLCNGVIVMSVLKTPPKSRRSAPLGEEWELLQVPSQTSQRSGRGAGMPEVWFLTQGSTGQGGQTGSRVHSINTYPLSSHPVLGTHRTCSTW